MNTNLSAIFTTTRIPFETQRAIAQLSPCIHGYRVVMEKITMPIFLCRSDSKMIIKGTRYADSGASLTTPFSPRSFSSPFSPPSCSFNSDIVVVFHNSHIGRFLHGQPLRPSFFTRAWYKSISYTSSLDENHPDPFGFINCTCRPANHSRWQRQPCFVRHPGSNFLLEICVVVTLSHILKTLGKFICVATSPASYAFPPWVEVLCRCHSMSNAIQVSKVFRSGHI